MSAYAETAEHVRELLARASVDEQALRQPIARCDLERCHGTCCYDGVYLNPDEARVIPQLVAEHRDRFQEFGVDLPEQPIVYGKDEATFGPKTATWPVRMSQLVADYPPHFGDTNCVFLAKDGRCALQRLAESQNLHRWYYKPFTCWMHPLTILENRGERPVVTLHSVETDPQMSPEYPGFVSQTHCGRFEACGQPARQVLAEELEMLSQIAGRDF